MDYSQFAFAVSVDNSELTIFVAGQRKGIIPILTLPVPGNVLTTESGLPLTTEDGQEITIES